MEKQIELDIQAEVKVNGVKVANVELVVNNIKVTINNLNISIPEVEIK